MTSEVSFTVVSDTEAFRALEADWRDLCGRAEPHSIFLKFDWQWRAWQHVAAARGYGLRILAGRVGERLVLIWPLVLNRRLVRFLCSEKFEYRGALVERGPLASEWLAAAWRQTRRLAGGDAVDLRNLPADSRLAGFLEGAAGRGRRRSAGSPVIRLNRFAGWDDYAASLPKGLLSDQQRQWRRLKKASDRHQFHVVDEAGEIDALVDWIFTHKLAWAAKRGIATGVFSTAEYRAFIRAVLHDSLAAGNLVLCRLGAKEQILSAGFGFIDGRRFIFYMFSYDEAYQTFSPSRLLMERLIRRCMEMGLDTFDFLPGNEAYKRIWADSEDRVVDHLIPTTLLGHGWIAATTHFAGRGAAWDWLMALYRAAPLGIRRALRRRWLWPIDRYSTS